MGLLAAGCGSQVPAAPTPLAVADASRVDMCTILTDAELIGLSLRPDSRKQDDVLGVVGCGWVGKPFTLSLNRDNDNLAAYQARREDPAFVSFEENTVNGGAGVQLGVRRDRSQCAQFMDGGPVSLVVSVAASPSLGGRSIRARRRCIAQMIEPRLPNL